MYGLNVAMGSRRMAMEAARHIGRSGEPWCICRSLSFTHPFLLVSVIFRTTLRTLMADHLETGVMPLHWVGLG